MGWLLMVLIDTVPYLLDVDTEEECYATGHSLVAYYKPREIPMIAICRRTFTI